MFCHIKLVLLKIDVDVVYTLFSSTAISVTDGICIKQTLFSFFNANVWRRHPAFKSTDMYSVVSFLEIKIFWCSNHAYFVILRAHGWINSFFLCWIQVSLRFAAFFFWQKTCLFFLFYSKFPASLDLLVFLLLISQYWIP